APPRRQGRAGPADDRLARVRERPVRAAHRPPAAAARARRLRPRARGRRGAGARPARAADERRVRDLLMLTRRDVLRAGAATLISGALGRARGQDPAKRRLVIVIFGGGVRSRDAIGSPLNAPNLARIAAEGSLLERVRVEKALHQ